MTRALMPDPATGRRHNPDCRQAILDATHALLEEQGFGKLSIEGIASRAGAGKATIYRWWPNKGALAMEAFLAAVAPAIAFPHSGSARADILAQVQKAGIAYRGGSGQIVREMIGLGQSDPETRRLFAEGYIEPRRNAAKEVLRRGIAQAEFREALDLEAVVDAIYGPLFYRMLNGHAPIDARFIETHVTLILDAIAQPLDGASHIASGHIASGHVASGHVASGHVASALGRSDAAGQDLPR